MPIYEFRCKQCDRTFEKLFASSQQKSSPSCPECESSDTTQLFSVFGVGTLDTGTPTTDMPMCGTCGHHTPKPECVKGLREGR